MKSLNQLVNDEVEYLHNLLDAQRYENRRLEKIAFYGEQFYQLGKEMELFYANYATTKGFDELAFAELLYKHQVLMQRMAAVRE